MKSLEKIIRYLDGEMEGEEKRLFEKELVGDKALRQSQQLMDEIDRAIDDDRLFSFKEKLKETQELYNAITAKEYVVGIDSEEPVTTHKFSFNWKYTAAAVTLFIIISAVVFNFSQSPNDRMFASYYDRYEANYEPARVRGSASGKVNDLITAVQLYDQNEHKEATALLDNIVKYDPDNTPARFFLGLTSIEIKNYDKAIANLMFVISQSDITYIEHAKWYLALCYVKSNQTEHAISILNDITSGNNYYKTKALDLLKKIK